MQPDYSRQMLLKEVGAAGQASLAASRALIVGAGGFGSPVLQYLAGAGVGFLGLIDADTLHASNLHRQPIYALDEIGDMKAALAGAAVARLNPGVRVEAHAARLTADNALELIRAHDVVVDCSDNFRTKFLINDAAVLAQRPAVFASVYQYEGQLQVYKPLRDSRLSALPLAGGDRRRHGGQLRRSRRARPGAGRFRRPAGAAHAQDLARDAGTARRRASVDGLHEFLQHEAQGAPPLGCDAPRCALIHDLERDAADIEVAIAVAGSGGARPLRIDRCANRRGVRGSAHAGAAHPHGRAARASRIARARRAVSAGLRLGKAQPRGRP